MNTFITTSPRTTHRTSHMKIRRKGNTTVESGNRTPPGMSLHRVKHATHLDATSVPTRMGMTPCLNSRNVFSLPRSTHEQRQTRPQTPTRHDRASSARKNKNKIQHCLVGSHRALPHRCSTAHHTRQRQKKTLTHPQACCALPLGVSLSYNSCTYANAGRQSCGCHFFCGGHMRMPCGSCGLKRGHAVQPTIKHTPQHSATYTHSIPGTAQPTRGNSNNNNGAPLARFQAARILQ